jgi:uncharacterized membrane protein
MTAFVGEQKKFTKPVLVTMNKDVGLKKIGFITQETMIELNHAELVSVYLPHSYNFSGNVYLIDSAFVEPIDVPSSEVMRFIISGGVTTLNPKESEEKE